MTQPAQAPPSAIKDHPAPLQPLPGKPPAHGAQDKITVTTSPGSGAAQTFTDVGQAIRVVQDFLRASHATPFTGVIGGSNSEYKSVQIQLSRTYPNPTQ